jgi:hypothetical protein
VILEKFTVTISQFLQIWKITGEILSAAVTVINSVVYSCNASECSLLYQKILGKFSSFFSPHPPECYSVLVAFSVMFQYVITKTSVINVIIKQVTVFATSHSGVM